MTVDAVERSMPKGEAAGASIMQATVRLFS